MDEQIRIANNLDLLLVLGSGKSITPRCDHTFYIQKNINKNYIDTILSGKGTSNITEAESMKNYLTFLGLPEKHCYLEEKSMDTLGNMVFSQPIISQILSGHSSKKLGLVTQEDHMARSVWLSKKVFGNRYEVYPLPAPKVSSLKNVVFEYSMRKLSQLDLWLCGIEPGNQKQFEDYIINKHPLYFSQEPSIRKFALMFLKK